MPEVTITIGGRDFAVACQEGEEHYLQAAATMLDTEASALAAQIGRLPESRMLLMSGLMLADKTAGMEDQVRELEAKLASQEEELKTLRASPKPEPEKIEVAVVPESLTNSLSEIAAQAEALAGEVEERAAG